MYDAADAYLSLSSLQHSLSTSGRIRRLFFTRRSDPIHRSCDPPQALRMTIVVKPLA